MVVEGYVSGLHKSPYHGENENKEIKGKRKDVWKKTKRRKKRV